MVFIINYQSGNLGAILNMFKRIGVEISIAQTPEDLENASKIILPGVGAFDAGMQNLLDGGWLPILNKKVLEDQIPTLGICLGMQLMTKSSEEGTLKGLSWIDGVSRRFAFTDKNMKVPHMGWNKVKPHKTSKLISGDNEKRFYFAHSYYVSTESEKDSLLKTFYGFEFTSAIEKENILGVQFHPEKSHRFGMELLKNFANNY